MPLVFTVPQAHCVIIERFGKYHTLKKQGLRVRAPFIDKIRYINRDWGDVANKDGYLIELAEQQSDTGKRTCQTKDNVTARVDAIIYWRIMDPRRGLYAIDRLPKAVTDSGLNALRAQIGSMDFDDILKAREAINERIAISLRNTTEKWGINIVRVEIQEIETDKETITAMRQQMDAERKSRAVRISAEAEAFEKLQLAEAEKQATILMAEGQAKAKILTAQADLKYLELVGQQASASQAAQLLAAQKYIEGFKEISQNKSDKVYLPSDFGGIFTMDLNARQRNSGTAEKRDD